MKPKAVLVEQAFVKKHTHFDSVPYSNIRIVDVARILDGETSKPKLNPSVVSKLIDRVLAGLSHTIIALQGRPEGTRVIGLLARSFNRILERTPEFGGMGESVQERAGKARGLLTEVGDDGLANNIIVKYSFDKALAKKKFRAWVRLFRKYVDSTYSAANQHAMHDLSFLEYSVYVIWERAYATYNAQDEKKMKEFEREVRKRGWLDGAEKEKWHDYT